MIWTASARPRPLNPTDPTQWKPIFSATIVRETHVADLPAGQESKVQVSFSYSDGLGREIQTKIQAEPGPLDLTDPSGSSHQPALGRFGLDNIQQQREARSTIRAVLQRDSRFRVRQQSRCQSDIVL